jgi:hypothetical protein
MPFTLAQEDAAVLAGLHFPKHVRLQVLRQ